MNSSIKFLASAFALSLVLISCKKEEEAVVSDTPKEIILPRVQPIPTGSYVTPQQTVQQPQQTVTPAPQPVAQNQVVTKPGMNPPHGQPGHRCDIQVGAPLSSPPGAKPATMGTATAKHLDPSMFTTTPAASPATAETTAVVTEPGKNPPHGQEGHVCSIPVGADLPKE
ncbi:hypothetical protein [Flavobacterium capsici]|uniref:Uncharacterized protein n=1 Tax=Flavobacterium capsici TaxID=3075618 RepID=A0AA96F0L2_9FLAO|nr:MULTISPECIES: hypothetical protein [unclassified Flavobacterium]WNM20395.1 hypothetical protein RN608_06860 [Flavobacterium sp. PMR2A8]WNM21784.1 hypothetical protein RN605_00160 [Flavobacterium sp. PMTSA4]